MTPKAKIAVLTILAFALGWLVTGRIAGALLVLAFALVFIIAAKPLARTRAAGTSSAR